eukprot:TRINITY_DN6131_c0_g1_i1.p1 TRINITY_DN6131_c0_g1~~TRINITY_DN6131_c0_g1_i1.p1  ORF type:complete len:286 (+),score=52.42 TRINITY_DN6131_c0_g1_i1:468-1325(+)
MHPFVVDNCCESCYFALTGNECEEQIDICNEWETPFFDVITSCRYCLPDISEEGKTDNSKCADEQYYACNNQTPTCLYGETPFRLEDACCSSCKKHGSQCTVGERMQCYGKIPTCIVDEQPVNDPDSCCFSCQPPSITCDVCDIGEICERDVDGWNCLEGLYDTVQLRAVQDFRNDVFLESDLNYLTYLIQWLAYDYCEKNLGISCDYIISLIYGTGITLSGLEVHDDYLLVTVSYQEVEDKHAIMDLIVASIDDSSEYILVIDDEGDDGVVLMLNVISLALWFL